MSLPTEATVLRWGATVGFLACFGAGLYLLGVSAAPWVAFLLGALVFAVLMGRLWVTHLDAAEAARSRAEGQGRGRLQLRDEDEEPETRSVPRLVADDYDD